MGSLADRHRRVLSARGWEYGEEVEENHIDTFGHGVRGPWMDDEIAKHYEERIRTARERRRVSKK